MSRVVFSVAAVTLAFASLTQTSNASDGDMETVGNVVFTAAPVAPAPVPGIIPEDAGEKIAKRVKKIPSALKKVVPGNRSKGKSTNNCKPRKKCCLFSR
jgi:hypothetical protein